MSEEKNLEFIKEKIFEKGFDVNQYNPNYLERRLKIRMLLTSTQSYRNYLDILLTKPDEFNKLIDVLTVNVTEFFRDPPVWELIKEKIIPVLLREKEETNQKILKFWSCGCASGEEPYSLSIMLKETLNSKFKDFSISIIATDIDKNTLKKAIEGEYEQKALKNVSKKLLDKYFIKVADLYKIKNEQKKMIKFAKHDFIKHPSFTSIDVVFCRNVIIYLTPEMKQNLFNKFYKALNSKGFLVIGKAETLFFPQGKEIFLPVSIQEHIFQKNDTNT